MKAYLMKFKGQAFEGSISLFKRTLVPGILLNLIATVISMLVFLPFLLMALDWGMSELLNSEEMIKEMGETIQKGGDPGDVFKNMFSNINYFYILVAAIIGLFVFSWIYNAFLTMNDNEVKNSDNNLMHALRQSFDKRVLTIAAYIVLQYILVIIVFIFYVLITVLFYKLNAILGVLFGFVLFFVMLMFFIKFVLVLPAIVHGKMSLGAAMSYSMKHITFKRSGQLLLIGLLFIIVALIISGISSFIITSIFKKEMLGDIGFYAVQKILSTIIGSITSVFLFAALTALYFRYSDDLNEDMEFKDHLIA